MPVNPEYVLDAGDAEIALLERLETLLAQGTYHLSAARLAHLQAIRPSVQDPVTFLRDARRRQQFWRRVLNDTQDDLLRTRLKACVDAWQTFYAHLQATYGEE